ncbi:MAG: SUMF1/EgtB/PvdO family nonheme iron enzyme [Candidatus Wallbacteria bacterium]|nr:SUMF1/EgtB/PvdO family nonheme iron enzyme [Candidatus Wallbacteria bacterium]
MRLKLENFSLSGINDKNRSALINCDVSWDEAWKNEINCDGVWLFAKYRIGEGLWKHVELKSKSSRDFDYKDQTPADFSTGKETSGAQTGIWVPETKKGMFIFRTSGEGNIRLKNLQLCWDYAGEGLSDEVKNAQVMVFGVEMAYIPQDKHFVGDPVGADGPKNCLYKYPDKGAYLIDSETEIRLAAEDGCLYCDQDNDRSRDEVPFVIPKEFPKGYRAFWYMKYSLNSRQYVDFLNALTRVQQRERVLSDISTDEIKNYYVMTNTNTESLRQTIVCTQKNNGTEKPIKFYTYAPARACNAIKWGDIAAFACWSGLRPVTELEFEKACRGPKEAVPSECAWGSTEIGRVDTFDGPDGSGYEIKVPTTGLVNCCLGGAIAPFEAAAGKTVSSNPGFEGPVSCGLFSNTRHPGIPKRINDGASYYGVCELSGNLWEPVVTFGNPAGRAFQPVHGTGTLDEKGNAVVKGWPDAGGAGAGVRGGVYRSPDASYVAVALRFAAAHTKAERRFNGGCRVGY